MTEPMDRDATTTEFISSARDWGDPTTAELLADAWHREQSRGRHGIKEWPREEPFRRIAAERAERVLTRLRASGIGVVQESVRAAPLGEATQSGVTAEELDEAERRADRYSNKQARADVVALVAEVRRLQQQQVAAGKEIARRREEKDDAHRALMVIEEMCDGGDLGDPVQAVERLQALTQRVAAAFALVNYDAHPAYGNTAGWRGGIGGATITHGCSIIDPPPDADWTQLDVPSGPLREFLAAFPFDLDAEKAELKAEFTRSVRGGRDE